MRKSYERLAVYIFGVIFIAAILGVAVAIPEPTAFQYTVFRIVLALSCAGVAAFIPGFIHVNVSQYIRAGGAIAVFVIIFFFSPAQLVVEKTPKNRPQYVGVEVLKQDRSLDLRNWKLVEIKDRDKPISPGIFYDTFTLTKVRGDASEFVAHHGTTGLKIDFASTTHNFKEHLAPNEGITGLTALKKYDVYLDIEQENINDEFELELQSTYWNSFNGNWAATPIMSPTKHLTFSITFPKPISGFKIYSFLRVRGAVKKQYKGDGDAVLSADKTTFRWNIPDPKLNNIYQVAWDY